MQVFSALVRSIQRTQAQLVESIEEKQRQTESWAGGFIAELEREVAELTRRKEELEKMARTDHIHFLKVRTAWWGSEAVADTAVLDLPAELSRSVHLTTGQGLVRNQRSHGHLCGHDQEICVQTRGDAARNG